MALARLRTGDVVEIITGKDRGKRGRVLQTDTLDGRVVVEGRNLVRRHSKPRPVAGTRGAQMTPGGVLEIPAALDASNVMLVCAACDKPSRVRYEALPEGGKARRCKRCGSVIEAKR
jgi:large subunit ribosomal protein L24